MKYIGIFFIEMYRRVISPILPSNCRFYPTCSTYAKEALKKFGLFKGTYLAILRIIRCNPFCKGGHDPLPEEFHLYYKKNNNEK